MTRKFNRFMLRSTHEREIKSVQKKAEYDIERVRNENDGERAKLIKILRQFYQGYVGFEERDLKLLFTMSSHVLRTIPAHDTQLFRYVARQMAGELERELASINLTRVLEITDRFDQPRHAIPHMED
ncbi:hypothetical protein LCGC14_0363760 [marine sediment metagenome]|uniref:Uncharacterized protein n=1 Tax=marine sediment metagenome TaxID=412755 RepID=A0A0F9TQ07_9ZZZZ